MLIKQGTWYKGLLKCKLPEQGWIEPKTSFLKQNGLWVPVQGSQVIQQDLGDLITTTTDWILNETRGWYRDVYPTVQDSYIPIPTKLSADTLSKIRKVSATFTGYYNTPAEGLNLNYLRIHLSNGVVKLLGTNDAWTDAGTGQNLYKGDAGTESKVTRNVINERYSFTVPVDIKVVGLDFLSYPAYTQGRYYPSSLRGMKDFEFTLRH